MTASLKYYSTNRISPEVTFSQALLKGQAPDRGLYMPEVVPRLTEQEIAGFSKKEYHEIAFEVTRRFLTGEISDQELQNITEDAYDFPVPLEHVNARRYIMRLDQGPTASFKDFAARMMGRLMYHYLKKSERRLLILTATSGDTGSAVANAFYGLGNISVVVLFPKTEVTDRQRRQMTTLGKNIRVLGLNAKFDDCQALVKQAFADPALSHLDLSSANSINIGRLVPQIVYYFYAFSRLRLQNHPESAVISVPSGNFGDMMGGVLAMKMGLPVRKFIIATNENDEFPTYLSTGQYRKIEPSRNCISSAMNVGHPSNLARLVDLYGGRMDENGVIHQPADMNSMQHDLYSVSITDAETRNTIRKIYQEHGVMLEPHGAVGWAGLMHYLDDCHGRLPNDQLCISLETAHPAKFPDEVAKNTGINPPLPESLRGIDDLPEFVAEIGREYSDFRNYLLTLSNW